MEPRIEIWSPGIGKSLSEFCVAVRKLEVEVLGLFDPDGTSLAKPVTSNQRAFAVIPPEWDDLLHGAALVHNHPSSGMPSDQDLRVYAASGVASMIVVGRHRRFILRRSGKEQDEGRLLAAWSRISTRITKEIFARTITRSTRAERENELLQIELAGLGFDVEYESATSPNDG